jgi:type III restriction enzyme
MNINLKTYQENAVEALIKSVAALLEKDAPHKVCVFQSPTGSGKTVVVAKFIEGIIKELPDADLCFLWISIGKGELHKQSKRSLEKIFDGFPRCVLIEDEFSGSRNIIEQNEVVVVNWEKLRDKNRITGEWKNKVMRDGENVNFIEVLENTRQKRKIILIIDESHYASDTDRTNDLREIVSAEVTLEMSATPKIAITPQQMVRGTAAFIEVDPKEVIEAGMIKKELIINEGLDKFVQEGDENTSQDIILEAAYRKRLEQKRLFEAIGANVNPLCLIQIPVSEAGENKREIIERFLETKGITETGGKLAIWLSGEKSEDIDEISKNDNKIEFLIFKQAIDTGWDCPRASILIKLREIQSPVFEIQTVGRILRMPEQKHYDNETLNVGNIFTNLKSIEVKKEEYNPNIIKHLRAVRKDIYKDLQLKSYYKNRIDYGDITRSIGRILDKTFNEEFGFSDDVTFFEQNLEKVRAQGLVTEINGYREDILENVSLKADKFDEMSGQIGGEENEKISLSLSDNDIYDKFNEIIKENLSGFAPKRSIPNVRGAIYQWFKNYLGIKHADGGLIKIQKLFLHPQNIGKFSNLLGKATTIYRPAKLEEVKQKIGEELYDWEVKKEEFYNQHADEKTDYKLCIYEPCFLRAERSTPERLFEKYLESQADKIEWWFKNGEKKKDFFGIRYEENKLPHTFYPDYIIRFRSGKTGIFDTKKGNTAKEAAPKAEALQAYISEQNSKGKNLIGGIIIQDANGKWIFNQKDVYSYDPNDLTGWEYFDEIEKTS